MFINLLLLTRRLLRTDLEIDFKLLLIDMSLVFSLIVPENEYFQYLITYNIFFCTKKIILLFIPFITYVQICNLYNSYTNKVASV